MATAQEMREFLSRITASLAGIRADVQTLKDMAANGDPNGLTAAQTQEIADGLATLATQLETLDSENPTTPTP